MKTFSISKAVARFLDAIQITETTDTNHADNINYAPKQVYENTLANRREIEALQDSRVSVVASDEPPAVGPVLWFCSDKSWRPSRSLFATALLGNPADADNYPVQSKVNETVYPVVNGDVSAEGDTLIATLNQ